MLAAHALLAVAAHSLLLAPSTGSSVSAQNGAPARWASYWYSVGNDYAEVAGVVAKHRAAVTSVILDCGHSLASDGRITGPGPAPTYFSAECNNVTAGLQQSQVMVELAIGLQNNSILNMRNVYGKGKDLAAQLLAIAGPHGIKGINLDWEPQTPAGTTADGPPYRDLLSTMRAILNAQHIRLTIDVADWSPTLRQYSILAPAVDRILDMETYNQKDWASWYGYYRHIVTPGVERSHVGIGIFPFALKNNTWPATNASVFQRVEQCIKDDVPEIFVFRLLPSAQPPWPWGDWWAGLEYYMTH